MGSLQQAWKRKWLDAGKGKRGGRKGRGEKKKITNSQEKGKSFRL